MMSIDKILFTGWVCGWLAYACIYGCNPDKRDQPSALHSKDESGAESAGKPHEPAVPSPTIGSGPSDNGVEKDARMQGEQKVELRWSHSPDTLRVFRSTAVHFRLESAPPDHPMATCSWNFGDGSPPQKGCDVSHTFHGGRADQVVILALVDGDWKSTSTKVVPLERLKVVKGLVDDLPESQEKLPPKPSAGDTNLRLVVLADNAAQGSVPEDVKRAVETVTQELRADLVLHLGGLVTKDAQGQAWSAVQEVIGQPLKKHGIPITYVTSAEDRDAKLPIPMPNLQFLDKSQYPTRYTFTFKGAFFLVFGPDDKDATVGEKTIQWMRDELSSARVYEARYVFSYLPLHKFSDAHLGSLDKRFRLYELFLRARVTTLFSAGYRVFYHGRYGALPIVSVGTIAGRGGRLAGRDLSQPGSFVVVDQVNGIPERIFAVTGPDYRYRFDETILPQTVEVYTR